MVDASCGLLTGCFMTLRRHQKLCRLDRSGKHHHRGVHSRKPLMRCGEFGISKSTYLSPCSTKFSKRFQPTRRQLPVADRVRFVVDGGRVQRSDLPLGRSILAPVPFSVTITMSGLDEELRSMLPPSRQSRLLDIRLASG